MKFTLPTIVLRNALESTVAAVNDRSTLGALKCIRIVASKSSVELTGSDMTTTRHELVRADDVAGLGSVAVAARDLLARVKAMSGATITIAEDNGRLVVSSRGSARRFTLPTMPADDYPPTARPSENAVDLQIPASVMRAGLAAVIDGVSDDITRPHMNGAQIECDDGVVRLISTDAHRMPVAELPTERTGQASALVQKGGCALLLRFCEAHDDARFATDGVHLFATADGSTLATKLLDASFPTWRQVIPQSVSVSLTIETSYLLDACKALLVSSKGGNGLFTLSAGKLKIKTHHPDSGDAEDVLAVSYDGKGAVVALDLRYVASALASVGGPELVMHINGDLDPIVFASTNGQVRVVVMPVRWRS